jgi:hypothetical protein
MDKPQYVHAVIFHVKKDAPQGEVEALIKDAHEMLKPIPSVREFRIGRPAATATPALANKDFHVGLLILFDDAEGLLAYHHHAMHLKYVEKHLPHVDMQKLMVYDFAHQEQ